MRNQDIITTTREVHAILSGIKALVAVDSSMDAAAVSMSCLADMGLEKLEGLWE